MDDKKLIGKIKRKEIKIGIIGLGYVGLPLALLFAKKGFSVTGFARSKKKAELFNKGINSLSDKSVDVLLQSVMRKKTFVVKENNTDDLQKQDVFIICVPTPVNEHKKPDITDLKQVAFMLGKVDLTDKIIINESTVAPFTTREVFGKFQGKYFLASSPERVDPGNNSYKTENIPKVLGGRDSESTAIGETLYNLVLKEKIVTVNSLEAAEMAKMLENTYRAVNIALINEFARLAEKCDIDILDVIKAAKTKWSFQAHYPTIGVGGHCIPVDPYYILQLAHKKGVTMNVVKQSLSENEGMPHFVVKKVLAVYKPGMKVLVYGFTYKKDINDVRESPVIIFCNLLKKKNIPFTIYDPYLKEGKIAEYGFVAGKLTASDIFIVGTDHTQLAKDYKKTVTKKTIIIDGRNYFIKKQGKAVMGIGHTLL